MDCNNAERSATEDKEEQTEEPCSKKLRLDDHSEVKNYDIVLEVL